MDIQALILDSRPGIKMRQFKYRLTYKSISNLMSDALRRYKECSNKKPAGQIRHEISLCKKFWGCYPLHYYRYDLYRQDKNLTEGELINYIPEFFFYNLFLPYYDSNKYEILLEEKNVTEQLLRGLGIKQPDTVLKLIGKRLYSPDFEETSFEAIQKRLINSGCAKIFLKPVDGKGGYGIKVFHRNDSGEYAAGNHEKFSEELLKSLDKDHIVQYGLLQDAELSKIYPDSVNTFRIATENIGGQVRIICAVLRIGRGRNEVDNASQGGMLLKVDTASGQTGSFAITELGQIFKKHPDTGFEFKPFMIPNWEQIKNFTLESAVKLPNFSYLGWDIALTAEGPAAIEVNLGFGLDLFQVTHGGLRQKFRIDNPKLYYKIKREKA